MLAVEYSPYFNLGNQDLLSSSDDANTRKNIDYLAKCLDLYIRKTRDRMGKKALGCRSVANSLLRINPLTELNARIVELERARVCDAWKLKATNQMALEQLPIHIRIWPEKVMWMVPGKYTYFMGASYGTHI